VEQCLDKNVAIPVPERPTGVLLDGLSCGFVCVLHDKVGERKAFEPGSALDAPFLFGKQASLSPFRA
jgi:hypothetical protein